jgi:glycosyltransferase involved in cell wall biosynthesis
VFGQSTLATARVIGGGVDTGKFSPDPTVARDGGALFVGRLLPHKGVADLIAGLPDGLPLTIVGPDPGADTKARLVALARGKQVTFKHGLRDAAVVDEYRRALCIVLPSVYRAPDGGETRVPELLGQTLLEGMACEAPAICTRVASMPEVVDDGVTGFVVPPNDPAALGSRLWWLQRHPEAIRQMGIAGRRRVLERFTWPLVVDRCLEAYRASMRVGRRFRARPVVRITVTQRSNPAA